MKGNMVNGNPLKLILNFALPLLLGNLFQQTYNMVDAAIVGQTLGSSSLAAVGATSSVQFLVLGFCMGTCVGFGIPVAQRFGAEDYDGLRKYVYCGGILSAVIAVVMAVGTVALCALILELLQVPADIFSQSYSYLAIIFAGIPCTILYNYLSSILRAIGDSKTPFYFLAMSAVLNIFLDFFCIVVLKWGVAGAAVATVISQGLSVILCLFRMCRLKDYTRLDFRKIRYHAWMMKQVLYQGLPSGIQNAVITVGNLVIQKNINSFGAYAMSGMGAYSKIEGFVFLPIMSMAMALPTFVSQNLGARQYHRAKKGAVFGILFGMITAEITGLLIYFFIPYALKIFGSTQEAITYGTIHAHIVSLFFFLLAFSHCAAGVMRGCGYAVVPMAGMLLFWCGLRIVYVTTALRFFPVFQMISWAYPLTWGCSTILFLIFLFKADWQHHLD